MELTAFRLEIPLCVIQLNESGSDCLFIPVQARIWKNQFSVVKKQSLQRVKQIIDFVDIYPEDSTARVQRALNSSKVLIYHKAFLGAHVQNVNGKS